MSSPSSPEYDAIIYYKIGIVGSDKDSVSSFVIKVNENTTIGQFNEELVEKLQKASIEVGAEFSDNLLQYLFEEMNKDNDEDQAQ